MKNRAAMDFVYPDMFYIMVIFLLKRISGLNSLFMIVILVMRFFI